MSRRGAYLGGHSIHVPKVIIIDEAPPKALQYFKHMDDNKPPDQGQLIAIFEDEIREGLFKPGFSVETPLSGWKTRKFRCELAIERYFSRLKPSYVVDSKVLDLMCRAESMASSGDRGSSQATVQWAIMALAREEYQKAVGWNARMGLFSWDKAAK